MDDGHDLIERILNGPPFPEVAEVVAHVREHGALRFDHDTPHWDELWRYLERLDEESPAHGLALWTDRASHRAEYGCDGGIYPGPPDWWLWSLRPRRRWWRRPIDAFTRRIRARCRP
jgi:hypothetical protein